MDRLIRTVLRLRPSGGHGQRPDKNKNHFWCHHCERGLFFPSTCEEHADTEVLGGGVETGLDDDDDDDGDGDDGFAGPFPFL